MDKIVLLLIQLGPLISAGIQMFSTVQAALSMIQTARAEGRDLTDAEMAEVDRIVGDANSAWEAELTRRRALAANPVASPAG